MTLCTAPRAFCGQPVSHVCAGDREDAPPLQLPAITSPKRIVLVRHGQSTWNAEGRVQGSSNFSYLTKRGQAQADTTRILVRQQLCSAATCPSAAKTQAPLLCH